MVTWDKLKPDGGAALNQGDDKIRLNFDHLEVSLAREHSFPNDYATSAGRHSFPVVSNISGMGVSGAVDGMIVGRTDVRGLFMRQSGTFYPMRGHLYIPSATRLAYPGGVTAEFPDGLLCVDSDTGALNVWNGSSWEGLGVGKQFTDVESATAAQQALTSDFSAPDLLTGMDITVTEPDDGVDYEIDVYARIPCHATGGGEMAFWLEESIDGGANTERDIGWFFATSANVAGQSTVLKYVQESPTTAKTHQYRVYGAAATTGTAYPNPTRTIEDGVGSTTFWARIWATLRRREV